MSTGWVTSRDPRPRRRRNPLVRLRHGLRDLTQLVRLTLRPPAQPDGTTPRVGFADTLMTGFEVVGEAIERPVGRLAFIAICLELAWLLTR